MAVVHEFPSNEIVRCVSPQRYRALTQFVRAVEECEQHLTADERNAPHFKPLWDYCYDTLSSGVSMDSLGGLYACSQNWLNHYRVYADTQYRLEVNRSQRALGELCRELNFNQLATHSDLETYRRHIRRGKLQVVASAPRQ